MNAKLKSPHPKSYIVGIICATIKLGKSKPFKNLHQSKNQGKSKTPKTVMVSGFLNTLWNNRLSLGELRSATSGLLVVAKSAKLCFRLWRKRRPLPCSSSPHKAGFAGSLDGLKAMEKRSHNDSIRILMTHEDCGNIEIQNNLWYNAINSKNLNLWGW